MSSSALWSAPPASYQIFSSSPQLLRQFTFLNPALPEETCLFPGCQPSLHCAGAEWLLEGSRCPAFLSLHPTSRPWGTPSPPLLSPSCFPGQVHPGHSTARGQSATFQWLHTTKARALDSCVGGGAGPRSRAGREKSSRGCFSHCALQSGTKSWSREGNRPRVPPEWARSSSSTSLG